MNWFIKCFRQYADFSGRARRKEYWWFVLINYLISLVLVIRWLAPTIKIIIDSTNSDTVDEWSLIASFFSSPFLWIFMLYNTAAIVPNIAVTVRRLHDIGRSGYWYFLFLGGWLLSSLAQLYLDTIPAIGIALGVGSLAIAIVCLVWMFTNSQPGENKWGSNPKEFSPATPEQPE